MIVQQESAQPAPQATPLTLMLQYATFVDLDVLSAVLPTLTPAQLTMVSISQEPPASLAMPPV